MSFTHDDALFVEHCPADVDPMDFILGHAATMEAMLANQEPPDPEGDFRRLVAETPAEVVKAVLNIDDVALAEIAQAAVKK